MTAVAKHVLKGKEREISTRHHRKFGGLNLELKKI
jgi:hypothetical protein